MEIEMYGTVFEDSWWSSESAVTPRNISKKLNNIKKGEDINIYINSPGGSVFGGMAIASMLQRLKKEHKINIHIDGLAASIATVITSVADKISMFPGSMYMIHNPWAMQMGDHVDMQQMANTLEKIRDSIILVYKDRIGDKHTDEALVKLMKDETWMTAKEAVDLGFADEVTGSEANSKINVVNNSVFYNNVKLYELSYKSDKMPDLSLYKNRGGKEKMASNGNINIENNNAPAASASTSASAVTAASASAPAAPASAAVVPAPAAAVRAVSDEDRLKNLESQLKELEMQNTRLAAENVANKESLIKIEKEKKVSEMQNYINVTLPNLSIDASCIAALVSIQDKLPEDYNIIKALLESANNASNGLYDSKGQSEGVNNSGSAYDVAVNKAKALMEKNNTLKMHDALQEVFKADIALYDRYIKQQYE